MKQSSLDPYGLQQIQRIFKERTGAKARNIPAARPGASDPIKNIFLQASLAPEPAFSYKNNMTKKSILIYALTALMIPLLCSIATADSVLGMDQYVYVGVYQNKPKIFTDENGKASGLFIDLLHEIAEAEDWTLIYVPCEWAQCLESLKNGGIDLMPDVAYSQVRDRQFDFHHLPVVESWSRLYTQRGRDISTMKQLVGKRVALLKGSIQEAEFEMMMRGFGYEVETVRTKSYEESFRLTQQGKADAAVTNHFFGDYFYRDYNLTKTPVVFQMSQLFYATPEGRNPDLLRDIDKHLETWRIEPNSVYYTILARWMDKAPVRILPSYIPWIIGIIISLLILAGAMIAILRMEVKKRTKSLEERSAELKEALQGTIAAVSMTVEKRDPYTAGHQVRVANLAKALAVRMELDEERIECIYQAGLIHDIGKISIPIHILTKSGKLTEDEFTLIKKHPKSSFDILDPITFPWPIAEVAYQHHERINGSGYPRGLKGDEILMEARILAVADVVEAMSLNRPYRKALGVDSALKEIAKNKGALYDETVVETCLQYFSGGGRQIFDL